MQLWYGEKEEHSQLWQQRAANDCPVLKQGCVCAQHWQCVKHQNVPMSPLCVCVSVHYKLFSFHLTSTTPENDTDDGWWGNGWGGLMVGWSGGCGEDARPQRWRCPIRKLSLSCMDWASWGRLRWFWQLTACNQSAKHVWNVRMQSAYEISRCIKCNESTEN